MTEADPSARQPTGAPGLPEVARTLVHSGRVGVLCTHSAKVPGFPFGSLAPYGVQDDGSPTFLFSALAVHTRNLETDPRASLFLSALAPGGDPQAGARVTLLGTIERVPDDALEAVRADYLSRHGDARSWVDFADLRFYRIRPTVLYVVAGFGSMGWIDAPAYERAAPDPLGEAAAGILAHMNADHADALTLYCRVYANMTADKATMTAIDQYGFLLQANTAEGLRTARIAFPHPARTPEEARQRLVKMVQAARKERTSG